MAKSRSRRGGKMNATGRTATDRFIKLAHYMLRSAAWKTLSPNAKALLIEVWARHNGANNGEISYAVREAEDIGLSKDQAARAFRELTERGFLKMHKASTFTLKTKEARTWELTAEQVGDNRPSKDFMRWAENETRSHQRDGQSHQRDRKPTDETILPISVAPARPSQAIRAPAQSHQCDTYNIPSEVRIEGSAGAASVQPEQPATTSPTDLDRTTSQPAGRHRQRHDDGRNIGVWDIEEYLATKAATAPVNQTSPTDRLRESVKSKLATSAKGTQKALALLIGVSPCHLSNFLGGRFGLTNRAVAMLQDWLDGRIVIAPPKEAAA